MPRIRTELDLTIYNRKMPAIDRAVSDFMPFFRGWLDPRLSLEFDRQFEREGGVLNTSPWAPHSPLTTVLRARPGHGRGGIGEDFSDLRESLANIGPRSIRFFGLREYLRGTSVGHAAPFHLGSTQTKIFGRTRQRPVRVPARPLWDDPLPRRLTDDIGNAMAEYVEQAAG